MKKVYLFNDWHNGDVITNRALIKALLNYDIDLVVGSYKNRHYLVEDLPVKHIISEHNEQRGAPSLAELCPDDYMCINTWCGTFPDIDKRGYHNWCTIVDTFNRQSATYKLGITLTSKEVPMIDFEKPCRIKIRRRAIYVENGPTRSGHCQYEFPVLRMAKKFPEFGFYCTDNPKCSEKNIIDCRTRNLVELSGISNQCEAIVGKGSGPFICTLTEINRLKPKAVMQFRAPKFWLYRGNPLRYLETDDELFNMLEEVRNAPCEYI